MKLFDISREMFSAIVYPGDPVPAKESIQKIADGDICNLTKLIIGSHSGTHMDAQSHFLEGGQTIERMELSKCVGKCKVIRLSGRIEKEKIESVLDDGTDKLLIAGDIVITTEAARIMGKRGLQLIGVEGQTVGLMEESKEVHVNLLENKVAIVEGLMLEDIQEGEYFLVSQPLKMAGVDGSPCRPVLIQW